MKSLLVKLVSYNQEALTVIPVPVTGATFSPISDHKSRSLPTQAVTFLQPYVNFNRGVIPVFNTGQNKVLKK